MAGHLTLFLPFFNGARVPARQCRLQFSGSFFNAHNADLRERAEILPQTKRPPRGGPSHRF